MELSAPRLKTFLYFLKKKFFLYFGKWSFLVLRFKNFRRELSELKKTKKTTTKKNTPKKFLYVGKLNPLAPSLKNFLYFKSELAKPGKQKFLYSLKKFS